MSKEQTVNVHEFFDSLFKKTVKILACGCGQQSTALALMACENKHALDAGLPMPYPLVPIYDLILFCDMAPEADWVYYQAMFIAAACKNVGIEFVILKEGDGYGKDLYKDYMDGFGFRHVKSIPFWSLKEVVDKTTGEITYKKGAMPRRACTLEYKIYIMQKYIKYEVLGYRKYQRLLPEDAKAHEVHIGFSAEESKRCKENPHPMFVNVFPLVKMNLTRADNYAYCLETWGGLDTKASACIFCPFHSNSYFMLLKEKQPHLYEMLVAFDDMLGERQPMSKIINQIFVSKSCKRICDLKLEDCNDTEYITYNGQLIDYGA